jgi:predicted nucleotidyltransferase
LKLVPDFWLKIRYNKDMNYIELQGKRNLINKIAAKYGAKRIRVFGSVARGDSNGNSDLDLLVDLDANRSLFDLGGLLYELQQSLAISVDVVTENGLSGEMRQRVLAEAIDL